MLQLRHYFLAVLEGSRGASGSLLHGDILRGLWGIRPPPLFNDLFEPDSYESSLYKGHIGFGRLFKKHPNLPWYGLVGDDAYLFDDYLVQALHSASGHPGRDPVCAGYVARLPTDPLLMALYSMMKGCTAVFGDEEEDFIHCLHEGQARVLRYSNATFVYGAAIFCSQAAMQLMAPFLRDELVTISALGIIVYFCLYKTQEVMRNSLFH